MAETVLISAATVAAGDPTDVVAHALTTPPEIDFRIVCDNAYTVVFYVANADFTDVDDAADLDGYGGAHAATTGTVYRIDAGSYDYVAAVVTNTGVDAATVTVAVGFDLVAEAPTALFTVAEARAFDKAQLASATDYPDITIIAAESAIRQRLSSDEWCGVDFIPTTHTDEYHSGDGTCYLDLDRPRITSITAAGTRSSTTWTALTVDELAALHPQTEHGSMVYREGAVWPHGVRNIQVTYVAGFTTVPDMVHTAALDMLVDRLCVSNVPYMAEGYEAGGTSYSWQRADGYGGNYSSLPSVMAAIRAYKHSFGGIA